MTDTTRDQLTSDFRALCAELTAWAEKTSAHYFQPPDVLLRARAALADGPAVPQGREPASVTGQPSDEELALIYHDCCRGCEFMDQVNFENAARAVLTRWGNPAPPSADGEVTELTGQLIEAANGAAAMGWDQHAQRILRAAELLERQVVVPVAVSVRLPGPEDCDAEVRCWWFAPETEVDFGGWTFGTTEICANSQWVDWENTHWLPAHALPLPEAGE